MHIIKALGTGCANRNNTLEPIVEAAAEIRSESLDDLQRIMGHGVMSTSGAVVDGKRVHADGLPLRTHVERRF